MVKANDASMFTTASNFTRPQGVQSKSKVPRLEKLEELSQSNKLRDTSHRVMYSTAKYGNAKKGFFTSGHNSDEDEFKIEPHLGRYLPNIGAKTNKKH